MKNQISRNILGRISKYSEDHKLINVPRDFWIKYKTRLQILSSIEFINSDRNPFSYISASNKLNKLINYLSTIHQQNGYGIYLKKIYI